MFFRATERSEVLDILFPLKICLVFQSMDTV